MIKHKSFVVVTLASVSAPALAVARETLPQIDSSTFASQIFWLVVSFFLFHLVISRLVIPRISGILQNRMRRIDADLSAARKYRREVDTSQKENAESLAKATQEAQDFLRSKNQSQQEQFQQELAKQMQVIVASVNEKESYIAEQKREALNSLDEMATELAQKCVVLAGGTKPTKAALSKAMRQQGSPSSS